jgi:hypothetical protein
MKTRSVLFILKSAVRREDGQFFDLPKHLVGPSAARRLSKQEVARREIKSCDAFKHLNIVCCDTCHDFYPRYEMRAIELADGSPAWVCDAVEWAIYPERYQALREWSRNSCEGKFLRKSSARTWRQFKPLSKFWT